jgi:hypothetical protein
MANMLAIPARSTSAPVSQTTTMKDAEPQTRSWLYRSRSPRTVSSARASRIGISPAIASDMTATAATTGIGPRTRASAVAAAAPRIAAPGMTSRDPASLSATTPQSGEPTSPIQAASELRRPTASRPRPSEP